MVKNLVIKKISTILTKYFKDVNEKTLELALLSGVCTLNNLELRTENIQKYFNYKINSITIGSVTLKYSLMSLFYKPIEVYINDLKISIDKNIEFNREDFIFEKLKFLEIETNKEGDSSAMSGLILQFYEKAIISIKNIEILFNTADEDEPSKKSKSFLLNIESISTTTVDDNWYENAEFKSPNEYFKVFEIQKIDIKYDDSSVVNACDLKCRILVRKKNFDSNKPDINLEFVIPEVYAAMDLKLYERIVNCINIFSFQKSMKQIIKDHPNLFDIYTRKELGTMSKFSTIMNILATNPKIVDSEEIILSKKLLYYELYQKFITGKIKDDEAKQLNLFEENEEVNFILEIRKKVLNDKKLQPKRNFFFWTQNVTKEEKKKLCEDLQIEETKENVNSFKISFMIKKLEVILSTENDKIHFLFVSLLLNHNSLINRTNLVLQKMEIFDSNGFITKSLENENFALFHYEKEKLLLSFNHLNLRQLFKLKNLISEFLKYKIQKFSNKVFEIESQFFNNKRFTIETNDIRYSFDSDKKEIIFLPCDISGDIDSAQINFNGISFLDKENEIQCLIVDKTKMNIEWILKEDIANFNCKIEEIKINEECLINNISTIAAEGAYFVNSTTTPQETTKYPSFVFSIEKIFLTGLDITLKELKIQSMESKINFLIERINYCGIKILNINLDFYEKVVLNSIEFMFNLDKINILKLKADIKYFSGTSSSNDTNKDQICLDFLDRVTLNQISILLMDSIYLYNLSIRKIENFHIIDTKILTNKSEIFIKDISLGQREIIFDNIIINRHLCLLGSIQNILLNLKKYNILPLDDQESTIKLCINLNNIFVTDYNITNYNVIYLKSKNINIQNAADFKCCGDIEIFTPDNKNSLLLPFNFSKSKITKSGSNKIIGYMNTELTRSLVYTLMGIIDMILVILGGLFIPNENIGVLEWITEVDLSINNYIKDTHLVKIIGNIVTVVESNHEYILDEFDTKNNLYRYHDGRTIHLLAHESLYDLCTQQQETYNFITVNSTNLLGYSEDENLVLFIENFGMSFLKNRYSMNIDFSISDIFSHIEIHKILILKNYFLPMDLSFGLPSTGLEIVVQGNISYINYKNLGISNFAYQSNQITFNLERFIEQIKYDDIYEQEIIKDGESCIKKVFKTLDKHYNSIHTPASVSIIILASAQQNRYNIEINDLFIHNAEIYGDYMQFYFLFLSELERTNKLFNFNTKLTNIFSIECRSMQIMLYKRIFYFFEYASLLNSIEKPTEYEGCFICHVDVVSNRLLEKHFYSFKFSDNVFKIQGHDILRAKLTKASLYEHNQKIIEFFNLSDLSCSLYYEGKQIEQKENVIFNNFIDSDLKFVYSNKQIHIKAKDDTTEFEFEGNVYFIDVSIRNDKILLRVYNNIVFKNYTNLKIEIHVGDENVTEDNFLGKIKLSAFDDGSFSCKRPGSLFYRLFPEGWNNGQDVFSCADGNYFCAQNQSSFNLKSRRCFLFLCDGSFRFISSDLIIVERNGFRFFYVLIYIQYFINNCSGIDISFLFRNKTYKFTKEISLTGYVISDENNQMLEQYDETRHMNIQTLPFANLTDNVELYFSNTTSKHNSIILNGKNKRETVILIDKDKKHGVMYERKERKIHNVPYLSFIEEITIYPFYIVNNSLGKNIHLGHTLIQTGRNFLDFDNKKVKLLFNLDFKCPNEINLGSIELFIVLKLQKQNIYFDASKYFTEKSVFNKLKISKIFRDGNSRKDKRAKLHIIENTQLHKNIAVEMNYGNGKYSNTRIINIDYANIIQNSTNYIFLLSVGREITLLSPGESKDIHFGEIDFFYIFFVDEFGFQEVEDILNDEDYYKYFLLNNKIYKISRKSDKYLRELGSYVNIKGLSPKYFNLKRNRSTLFKLITFINGKQRFMKITTASKWPIIIENKTDEVISVCQVKSQKKYFIKQKEVLNYCFDFLYKEKFLEIEHQNNLIKFSPNDDTIKNHGIVVTSYGKNDGIVIEIDYVSRIEENKTDVHFELHFLLPLFSLSICDINEEVCLHARNLDLNIKKITIREEQRFIFNLSGSSIQIDDQNIERKFPIIMNAKMKGFNMLFNQDNETNQFFRMFVEITANQLENKGSSEGNTIEYYHWRIIHFSFLIQEFYLRIDEDLFYTMLMLFNKREKYKLIFQCSSCENVICSCYLTKKPPCKYIKIRSLLINPMIFSVNFRKSKETTGIVKKGLSILFYNISDYKVKFDAEFLHNIDNPMFSIREVIINHYKSQIYRDLFKFLLSVDLLGNIGSFTDTFSMGIKDLFYEPFLGAGFEDPKKMSVAILKGGTSLVKHTVSGLSGIFSKVSEGFSKNISLVTFDKDFQNYNKNLHSGYIHDVNLNVNDPKIMKSAALKPIAEGYDRFVESISSGVTGIIERPYEGAHSGFGGFIKGIGKGCIGMITKPAVGLFDMIGGMADGIKSGMDGGKLCRLQYPRFSLDEDYNFEQNMSYYIYQRYLTHSAPKFIRGELRENQHLILTLGMVFVFNKKTSYEILFEDISTIYETSFVFHRKRITASQEFIRDLKRLRGERSSNL